MVTEMMVHVDYLHLSKSTQENYEFYYVDHSLHTQWHVKWVIILLVIMVVVLHPYQ